MCKLFLAFFLNSKFVIWYSFGGFTVKKLVNAESQKLLCGLPISWHHSYFCLSSSPVWGPRACKVNRNLPVRWRLTPILRGLLRFLRTYTRECGRAGNKAFFNNNYCAWLVCIFFENLRLWVNVLWVGVYVLKKRSRPRRIGVNLHLTGKFRLTLQFSFSLLHSFLPNFHEMFKAACHAHHRSHYKNIKDLFWPESIVKHLKDR